ALGLTGVAVVTAWLAKRAQIGAIVTKVSRVAGAAALVAVVIVATAALAQLAAPAEPGAEARLLLAPPVAGALAAAFVVWSVRVGGMRRAAAGRSPLWEAIARWGVLGWVASLAIA